MTDEEKVRGRIGELVRVARVGLQMDVAELARRADVDVKTIRSLERGERWPRESSRAKIESALNWNQGFLTYLLNGEGRLPKPGSASVLAGESLSKPDRSEGIDDYLEGVAGEVFSQYAGMPSGYVPVPLAALVEISLQADSLEGRTGSIATYLTFEELDVDAYESIVSEIDSLEDEVMELTAAIDRLMADEVFLGKAGFAKKLKRFVAMSDARKRHRGEGSWRYRSDRWPIVRVEKSAVKARPDDEGRIASSDQTKADDDTA
ncbi:multiprotein-bridging factor 1 family protein [Rhodococcus qingshengii]|uniref:multiprotein-bridging factor 1 family protein n=1 Tax=Rhodococcus qingshengii TaxID=334542 RepID=UPI0037C75AEB